MTVVTALLEYFEWTQVNNTAGQRAWFFCASFFNHASSWGRLLMLISYLGSIIKGCVPLCSIIMIDTNKWVCHRASMHSLIRAKEKRTIHDLITLWAY